MAKNGIYTQYDDEGFPVSPVFTQGIAASAGTTVLKTGPGRLAKAVVTTAGTASDNITIYDNATTGSGTILAVIPGGGTVGAVYPLDLPFVNGLTVVNVASGPAATIGWS